MKQRNRFWLGCMVLCLLVCLLPMGAHGADYDGQCGDLVVWKLSDDGELTIYGNGPMYDYSAYDFLKDRAPWDRAKVRSVVIEEGVTNVGTYAFYHCTNLVSVKLPEGLKIIGGSAFKGCKALETVELPDSLKTISGGAFAECTSLKELALPEGLDCIDTEALKDCESLTSLVLPDSVRIFGPNLLENCKNLVRIELGRNIENPEDVSFQGCEKLSEIIVDQQHPQLYTDESGILFRREPCSIMAVPRTIQGEYAIPEDVVRVGAYAFEDCVGLTGIQIPEDCTIISEGAFENCDSLPRVVLPEGMTYVDQAVFAGCDNLAEVVFPETLTEILANAFAGCPSLTRITLPESVINIHEWAFYNCPNLKEALVYNLELSFYAKNVYYMTDQEGSYKPFVSANMTKTYHVNCTEPHFEMAFTPGTCTTLSKQIYTCACGSTYEILNTSEELGHDLEFSGTSWDCTVCGYSQLAGGSYGKTVQWSVSTDGVLTFFGEGKMSSPSLAKRSPWEDYNDQIVMAVVCRGVENVGMHCFSGMPSLEHVYLQDTVKEIEAYAFDGVKTLKSITVCDSLEKIGLVAFDDCRNLKDIYYEGDEAMWNRKVRIYPKLDGITIHYNSVHEDHVYRTQSLDATCETPGGIINSCFCGYIYLADEIPALGHDYSEWYMTIEPTEESEGEEQRDCARCGAVETRAIPKGAHVHFYEEVITDPTCTEGGFTTFTCECGESYTGDETEPLEHNFGKWTESKKPTCTEPGEEIHGCKRCDHTETREIEATGHSYTPVITPPTCTDDGYTTYTCECGEVYEDDVIEATGHAMGEWMESAAPGCTEPGEEIRGCDNCDFTEKREIEATGHSYTPVITPPTCTDDGYTTYYCECDEAYEDDVIEATGHVMGEWMESRKPTCTRAGMEIRGCDNCDYTEERETKVTGHDWTDWQIVREATETSEGEEQRACHNCGKTESRSIPKLDHVHAYTAEITEPTCEDAGFTTYTCACGDSYTADETDPLGHDLGDWIVLTQATCTENGQQIRVCARCAKGEPQTIAALGHDYADGTCKRCGEADPDYEAPTEPEENPFTDVPEGVWYSEPVLWAVEQGITTGTSTTTFGPNDPCIRAQVVTFLWRAMGKPEPEKTENPFTDVPEGAYYYKAVLWAVEKGITSGMTPTTFGPNEPCTRAQVVTFLWRAVEQPEPEQTENPFTDVTEGWFYKPVLWAVEQGVTSGMSPTTFAPNGPCTRAQVVTFLHRALKDR